MELELTEIIRETSISLILPTLLWILYHCLLELLKMIKTIYKYQSEWKMDSASKHFAENCGSDHSDDICFFVLFFFNHIFLKITFNSFYFILYLFFYHTSQLPFCKSWCWNNSKDSKKNIAECKMHALEPHQWITIQQKMACSCLFEKQKNKKAIFFLN